MTAFSWLTGGGRRSDGKSRRPARPKPSKPGPGPEAGPPSEQQPDSLQIPLCKMASGGAALLTRTLIMQRPHPHAPNVPLRLGELRILAAKLKQADARDDQPGRRQVRTNQERARHTPRRCGNGRVRVCEACSTPGRRKEICREPPRNIQTMNSIF